MRKLLVKNSLSGVAQSFINMALVFTTIPVFIRMLGSEEYGVFSLIIVVGSLNTFTNLGLTSSLIKFLAEQGKAKESHYDIVVTFCLTIFVLLPFTVAAIFFNKFVLLNILKVPASLFDEARWFYLFILGANFFLMIGQVAKAILDSGQRIVTTNLLQILYNFIYWGLILFVLLLGYHLPGVGLASFLAAFIWFISVTYKSLKYWGNFSLSGIRKNYKRIAKKQLSYGAKIYASGLIGFFYIPLTKILISNFIGITEVGFFDISLRFKNQLWGIISKVLYPLYPLICSLKDKAKIRLLVHDLEQKTFFFVIPVITTVIFVTYPFIQLWIGQNVRIIAISSMFIISAHLIGSTTVLPNYQFLIAKGHAQKTIILQGSNVFFNALIFFITFKWLGYYAVIAGNVGAILSSFTLSLYYQKKYLNSLIFDSWRQLVELSILAVVNFFLGYLLSIVLLSSWAKIILIPVTLAVTTLFMFRYLKLFSKEDILRYAGNNQLIKSIGIKILVWG